MAGRLQPTAGCLQSPQSFAADATALCGSVPPGVHDHVIAAMTCRAGLFGLLSFDLFGQFENVITDRAAFFVHATT